MKIESLNGTWMRRIGCGEAHPQTVPYSTLAVGHSTCYRSFTVRESFTRLFLKLDGITYHATVLLNGETLGEMLPYCEYEFEITFPKVVPINPPTLSNPVTEPVE